MFASTSGLNERQQEAASFGDANLRILAGPGTGKTTTLTARVKALLERGVAPERILLLTFTRRAAREIVGRVRSLHGSDEARRVVGGTFHSVAHQTLRRHHSAVGLPESFGVLDHGDAADLMDLVRGELGILSQDRRLPKKSTLISLYSRSVNTGTALDAVMREATPWCADQVEEVATIFRAFVARKRTLGLLDFDDLLLFWHAAVQDEQLGEEIGALYDHILVDEFQDVNQLQLEILMGLRRRRPGITMVGDDAQAVYGFRGASPRYLLDAEGFFPSLTTVTLDINYRSSAAILEVANAIASDAPEGFSAVLREHAPIEGASAPQLVSCADERSQSSAVTDRVLELYEQGVSLQNQAVLFRAAHHSADLEIELSRRRIPFVKYGGLRYLEAAHVKDLLAAFRLADNPRDEMAWFRLFQLMPGVGPAKARRAINAMRDQDGAIPLSHLDINQRWGLIAEALPDEARVMSQNLSDALCPSRGEELRLHASRVRNAIAPLIVASYEESAPRLEDLEALVNACAQAPRLSDVAAEQALEPPASTGALAGPPSIDEDWLVLSTVHSAKGLEFDAVHMIHCADGFFPSDMSLGSKEGLEEERRLFYVGITRARRNLSIYVPLRYHHHRVHDAHSWAQPSRFLSSNVRSKLNGSTADDSNAKVSGPEVKATVDASRLVTGRLSELW